MYKIWFVKSEMNVCKQFCFYALIIIEIGLYLLKKVRFRIFACCFTDQERKKGEKTYMAEALGLTGSVSCLVKNKKEISLLLEKHYIS